MSCFKTQYMDKKKTSANRDALCKELYRRLFDWAVRVTNKAISAKV